MNLNTSDPTTAYELAHIHQDRRYQLITSSVVFGTLALICVITRLFARRKNQVSLGLDDYLIVVAMVKLHLQITLHIKLLTVISSLELA